MYLFLFYRFRLLRPVTFSTNNSTWICNNSTQFFFQISVVQETLPGYPWLKTDLNTKLVMINAPISYHRGSQLNFLADPLNEQLLWQGPPLIPNSKIKMCELKLCSCRKQRNQNTRGPRITSWEPLV